MPRATQLELRLPAEIGTLARLCRDLASGGVNLLAIATTEAHDRREGAVRLLVANRELASVALKRAGYAFTADEVLFVEIKNRPGALARTVEKLARARIDIRFAYATAHLRAQKTAAVIAVGPQDLERADKLLGP
jgi:hypothetical protein